MIRATNTGATAVIDHHGVVTPRAPAVHGRHPRGTVEGRQGLTPFARVGRPLRPLAAVGARRSACCSPSRRAARPLKSRARHRAASPPCLAHEPGAMLSFQQIILRLQSYWAERGCALLQPYDMEVGAGTSHTATFLRALGPEPWKAAYVQPSRRPEGRPLRREPEPPAALLPVPGGAQAGAGRHPRPLPRLARGARLRPEDQRRPLRRGRLGEPDARRLGPRLGGLAERHGGDAVHLLPAGRRHRLQADHRRDHLRPRAAGDVPAGRRQRLQAAVDRGPRATATSTTRTRSSRAPTTSRRATSSSCSPPSPRTSARRRR